MKITQYLNSLLVTFVVFVSATFNVQAQSINECLKRVVVGASVDTTVGDLHALCVAEINNGSTVDTNTEERLAAERVVMENPWTLLQHKTNYVLPVAYNFKSENIDVESVPGDARELDATEFKFQLSFKSLLWNRPFDTNARLYAGYTNTSWWQAYNKDESSPFRETNHQPELFLDIPSGLRYAGWELANLRLGINHTSNGRSGAASRTWNRVYAELMISNEFNEIRFKPWNTISDIEDNPNIDEFSGKFQLEGLHHIGKHTLNWKARHNLESESRGSVEFDWSFPIAGRDDLQFFVQYFDGYGESLIDFDIKSQRLGLGFKLGN